MTERRKVTGFGKTATSAIAAKMMSQAWAIRKMPFHSIRSRNAVSWSDVTRSRAAIRCDATALVADIDRLLVRGRCQALPKTPYEGNLSYAAAYPSADFYDGIISIIQWRER